MMISNLVAQHDVFLKLIRRFKGKVFLLLLIADIQLKVGIWAFT